MVEIRIILSETEYERALAAKDSQRWKDLLLRAIGLEAEKSRSRGRPKTQKKRKNWDDTTGPKT